MRITTQKEPVNDHAPLSKIHVNPSLPVNQSQTGLAGTTHSSPTRTTSDFQVPIHAGSTSTSKDGVDYGRSAGIGLDGRTDAKIGAQIDSEGKRFVGGIATAGGGLYADAGVSQSGKIGDVNVANRASVGASLATEGEARAGISEKGATNGVKGLSGAKAGATVGSDIGPVG